MQHTILYFSGTGGTELVANTLRTALMAQNEIVQLHSLDPKTATAIARQVSSAENLVLLYPVHAFDAPALIYDAIAKLPEGEGRSCALFSISAGGDIGINRACRVGVSKALRERGWQVIYEDMVAMPGNFLMATPDPLVQRLLQVLPTVCERFARDIIAQKTLHPSIPWLARIMAMVGRGEKRGAPEMGRKFTTDDRCGGCGLCARNCPVDNISMRNKRPHFGGSCTLCMRCVGGCPTAAITTGKLKFLGVSGVNFARYATLPPSSLSDEAVTRGFYWGGVRSYLKRNQ